MSDPRIPPIDRPDILIPDAGPLIHLAQAGALRLLHEIGGAVVIVDMVRHELVDDPSKAAADILQDWIERGLQPGSNTPVRLELTETGAAYRLARLVQPGFRMKGGGETAILEWLGDKIDGADHDCIVLYENGKVPRAIAGQGLDANIDVLTTRAFLDLAERRHLIASAEDLWRTIIAASPTTNPRLAGFSQYRTPET
ncbi:MAG TPA: hypothetical protein VFC47_03395 [Caulobacteraceae bacterium]|nr:hypothetical protein [Caulobacteraceae bacterium]